MTRTWSILILAALGACGGKSKPPPPAPDNHAQAGSGDATGGAMIDQAIGGDSSGTDRAEGQYTMSKSSGVTGTASLIGLWVSPCTPGDEAGQFHRLTYNIGADSWALRSETFADDKCSKRKVLLEMAGTYTIKAESQTVPGAWETESQVTSRALTADDKPTAKRLGKACKAKLAPGVATDIHAAGCAALGELPADKLCTEYDLAGVDTMGDLHTGLRGTADLCAVERRPTAYGPVALTAHWNPTGIAECDELGSMYEELFACTKLPAESIGMMKDDMRAANAELQDRGGAETCTRARPQLDATLKQTGC